MEKKPTTRTGTNNWFYDIILFLQLKSSSTGSAKVIGVETDDRKKKIKDPISSRLDTGLLGRHSIVLSFREGFRLRSRGV